MNPIGIITQARLGSTRLPAKVLKVIGGKTVLDHHLDRLQDSSHRIYVATTDRASDDELQAFCLAREVPYFRGDEDDVLARFYGCAKELNLKTIVRVTSDCPLIDGKIIGEAIEAYQQWDQPMGYLSNGLDRTYPRGFDFEVFSFELLEMAFKEAKDSSDREHVTPFLHQNRNGKVQIRQWTRAEDRSDYRVTLDTPADFQAIKLLIENHGAATMTGEEIIALLEAHPEIRAINQHIKQKPFQNDAPKP